MSTGTSPGNNSALPSRNHSEVVIGYGAPVSSQPTSEGDGSRTTSQILLDFSSPTPASRQSPVPGGANTLEGSNRGSSTTSATPVGAEQRATIVMGTPPGASPSASASPKDLAGASKWYFVERVPSAAFVTVCDVVGEVFGYCEASTLLRLRLVCRVWHDHDAFHHFILAAEVLKEMRKERGGNQTKGEFPKYAVPMNPNFGTPLRDKTDSTASFADSLSIVAHRSRKRLSSVASAMVRSASQHAIGDDGQLANASFSSQTGADGATAGGGTQGDGGGDLSLFTQAVRTVQREEEKFDLVDEGWVVESSANRYGDTVTIAVVESERLVPFKGWCKKRFPGDPPSWQRVDDRKIALPDGLDSVRPTPDDWEWVGTWELVGTDRATAGVASLLTSTVPPTSNESWTYAMIFVGNNFSASYKPFVRRREWRRQLAPPGGGASHAHKGVAGGLR